MSLEVTWLAGAQSDMLEGYVRLGDAFYRRVDRAIGQLLQFPNSAPAYAGSHPPPVRPCVSLICQLTAGVPESMPQQRKW